MRLTFILFTIGLLLDRSSSHPLDNGERGSGTEADSKRNAQFRYFGQLLYNLEMKSCNFMRNNEHVVQDVLKQYLPELRTLTFGYCTNASLTTLQAKAAVLKHFHLEDYLESEKARLAWTPFDVLFNLWCDYMNNDNFSLKQLFSRFKTLDLDWELVFKGKFSNLRAKLSTLLADFEQFASMKQSERSNPTDVKSSQPMNEAGKVSKVEGGNHQFEVLSQGVLELDLKLCSFLEVNEVSVKELHTVYFQDLLEVTSNQCKNPSEASQKAKAELVKYLNLPESTESDNVTLLWTPFEVIFNLWCEVVNNDSFSLEQMWHKTKPTLLTWEAILRVLSGYWYKLKTYLFG